MAEDVIVVDGRQLAMRDERRKPQHGVVPPIGTAIALPPGVADGVGAHAEPHAELEQARESAGRGQADDQSLQDAEIGIGLHDAHQPQDGVGGHEAVGVEHHGKFVICPPALAEVADVAGLVAGIDVAPPVGDRHAAAPGCRQRREACFFLGGDLRVVGVAQRIDVKTVVDARGGKPGQHRLEIAHHALRRLVANAKQDGGRCRDRFIADDAGRDRHHGYGWIGKAQDEEADHRVPEADHHPGQRHRKQHEDRDIEHSEAAGRQRQHHESQRCGHGGGKQHGKQHPPAGHDRRGPGDFGNLGRGAF